MGKGAEGDMPTNARARADSERHVPNPPVLKLNTSEAMVSNGDGSGPHSARTTTPSPVEARSMFRSHSAAAGMMQPPPSGTNARFASSTPTTPVDGYHRGNTQPTPPPFAPEEQYSGHGGGHGAQAAPDLVRRPSRLARLFKSK